MKRNIFIKILAVAVVLYGNLTQAQVHVGDNLGNHKATQALDLNSNNLINIGAIAQNIPTELSFSTSGTIGTSAATVDVNSVFKINTTAAGLVLTLPTPALNSKAATITVYNSGSNDYTLAGFTLKAGKAATFFYNGSGWVTNDNGFLLTSINTPATATDAKGVTFSGGALTLEYADGSNPGIVSTGTQTFAGGKIFTGNFAQTGTGTFGTGTGAVSLNGATTAAGTLTVSGAATLNSTTALNGNATFGAGNSLTFTGSTSGTVTIAPAASTTAYSLTLPAAVPTASGQVLSSTTGGVMSWITPLASINTPVTATDANGATISSGTLTLEYASGSYPGIISTSSQTFAGAKTFNSAITAPTTGNTINSLIINAGALSGVTGYAQTSGNFVQTGTGTFGTGTGAVSLNGATTAAGTLTVSGAAILNSTTALNGNATLASGKYFYLTGNGSYTVGLTAPSSGMSSSYTLILPTGQATVAGQVLTNNGSGTLSWATPTLGLTIGTVGSSYSNGANYSGGTLTLGYASASYPGIVSTAAQTFTGDKTFTGLVYADKIYATDNGNGTNIYVGDDAVLGDINVTGAMSLTGMSAGSMLNNGYIAYGTDHKKFGYDGTTFKSDDDILPSASNTYSLGSPSNQWANLWLSNSVTAGSATLNNSLYLGGFIHTVSNTTNVYLNSTSVTLTFNNPSTSYPIDIVGSYSIASTSSFQALTSSGNYARSNTGGNVNVSLHTSGRIWCDDEIDVFSDRRIKGNITTLKPVDAISLVDKIRAVTYIRTDLEDKKPRCGFIAQEVDSAGLGEPVTIHPGTIVNEKDEKVAVNDFHSLDYSQMSVVNWAATKGLIEENKTLKIAVETLQGETQQLKKSMEELAKRLEALEKK